jgi:hypothetical protein
MKNSNGAVKWRSWHAGASGMAAAAKMKERLAWAKRESHGMAGGVIENRAKSISGGEEM